MSLLRWKATLTLKWRQIWWSSTRNATKIQALYVRQTSRSKNGCNSSTLSSWKTRRSSSSISSKKEGLRCAQTWSGMLPPQLALTTSRDYREQTYSWMMSGGTLETSSFMRTKASTYSSTTVVSYHTWTLSKMQSHTSSTFLKKPTIVVCIAS